MVTCLRLPLTVIYAPNGIASAVFMYSESNAVCGLSRGVTNSLAKSLPGSISVPPIMSFSSPFNDSNLKPPVDEFPSRSTYNSSFGWKDRGIDSASPFVPSGARDVNLIMMAGSIRLPKWENILSASFSMEFRPFSILAFDSFQKMSTTPAVKTHNKVIRTIKSATDLNLEPCRLFSEFFLATQAPCSFLMRMSTCILAAEAGFWYNVLYCNEA